MHTITAALGATVLATALGAGPATAAPAAAPADHTAVPAAAPRAASVDPAWCTRALTRTSVSTVPGSGAAGHYSLLLTVQNTSSKPCRFRGYPGLQLLAGPQGPTLGAPATWTPAERRFVTLIPNARATAEIQVTQAALYPACTHRSATTLQVILPDTYDRQAVALPHAVDACAQPGIALLSVRPLQSTRG